MSNNIYKITVRAIVLAAVATFPMVLWAYEAAPVAITKQATYITEKGAKLNAQGNPNEVADAAGWFEWGISGQGDVVHETPHKDLRSTRNTLTAVNATLVGLAPSTQYYFRYVVESSRGKDVGSTVYFTTKPLAVSIPPVVIVETHQAVGVRTNEAQLQGYVSPHGDAKTSTWFEWGTTQQLDFQTPQKKAPSTAGYVSANIKALTPGTIYFYRVVAENSRGITRGATRVFTTTGTQPALITEKEISQSVQSPSSGDGVSRTTTTSGASQTSAKANTSSQKEGKENPITSFFKKKNSSNETEGSNASGAQVASVAKTESPLGAFWNNLTGKSSIEVTVEKVGPKTVSAHAPVEYLVSFAYGESSVAEDARLSIAIPREVVYIGDNTANELLVEETQSGERTYVLPLGRISKDATRSFSLLGMTTSGADGFPDARVWLEYTNASGVHIVEASVGTAAGKKTNTASAGNAEDGGFLPSSFLGWLIYAALVVGVIIGVRKGKEYYLKRKEEIAEEENDAYAASPLLESSPPQVV